MFSLDNTAVKSIINEIIYRQENEDHENNHLFSLSNDELTSLMKDKSNYKALYHGLKNNALAIDEKTGFLLYSLVRLSKSKNIVEFGTSFGLSTMYLASAVQDNGGGNIITCEFEESKAEIAEQHFKKAGLNSYIQILIGDALNTLSEITLNDVDFLFLDGAKSLYLDVLNIVSNKMKVGSIIVCDDRDYCDDYIESIKANKSFLSIPINDDIEISIKVRE